MVTFVVQPDLFAFQLLMLYLFWEHSNKKLNKQTNKKTKNIIKIAQQNGVLVLQSECCTNIVFKMLIFHF